MSPDLNAPAPWHLVTDAVTTGDSPTAQGHLIRLLRLIRTALLSFRYAFIYYIDRHS